MQRALLPLLAVLVVVAGGAIWFGRDSGAGPAPAGGPGESSAPPRAPASESTTASEARAETRKDLAPPTPAAQPAAPAPEALPDAAQPRPGANVTVIFGGDEAFAEFYRDIDGTGRKSRLLELEGALAEYVDGDPSDPREFQKYQALKDEAVWLRARIEN